MTSWEILQAMTGLSELFDYAILDKPTPISLVQYALIALE